MIYRKLYFKNQNYNHNFYLEQLGQQFSNLELKLTSSLDQENSKKIKTSFFYFSNSIAFPYNKDQIKMKIFINILSNLNQNNINKQPSISPDKKGKRQTIQKLEEQLLKFHNQFQDLLTKENSSLADIQYLGKQYSQLNNFDSQQQIEGRYYKNIYENIHNLNVLNTYRQINQQIKSLMFPAILIYLKIELQMLIQIKKGYQANTHFLQKRFFSQRLDYNIESKNYFRDNLEQTKILYEKEKVKHKSLEGKVHSIVDLLAYDDVGMRLFYEIGIVNMSQIHDKYKRINVSFSENDLLCMMRQMITNTNEFIQNKWFYRNYQDLNGFVFVKAGSYQEYKIKYSNLNNSSADTTNYHFENIIFKSGNNRSNQQNIQTSQQPFQDGLNDNKQVLSDSQFQQDDDDVMDSQLSSIHDEDLIETQNNNNTTNTNIIQQEQIQLSKYNKSKSSQQFSSNRTSQEGNIKQQSIQNQINQQASQKILNGSKQLQTESKKNIKQQNINQNIEQNDSVWKKILIYEILQICSMMYNLFLEQNFGHVDMSIKENNEYDFLKEHPKFRQYLMSFIKNSENYEVFTQNIQCLRKDKTIPQYIQIEDTLIDQIRQEQIQNINAEVQATINHNNQLSKNKKKEEISISICRDELKSMAMIAIQTINKQLSNELIILQNSDRNKKLLPETQDFYDSLLNSNFLSVFDKSSLQIAAQIVEELLQRIDEKQNPFYYAEQIFNKSLIHFNLNTVGVNCIQLLRYCNSIIQKIQGNEINEICGKSYCLMSQVVLKQSNNRQRALEYVMTSYEIRKQVHGQQSRTIEFVESLKQIAHIYQQKGALEESYKYLEKALLIIEEIKHQFHRNTIQILTDLAQISFNMQNYQMSLKKCLRVLDIYKKCGSNLVSYMFPFIMNLYALVKIRISQQEISSKNIDNNMIKEAFKYGIRAAKLIGLSKSDQRSSFQLQIYHNLKQLYSTFLKSIESEEYIFSLQKTPEQKIKNLSITKRIEPFSLPINPSYLIPQQGKNNHIKQGMQFHHRSINKTQEYPISQLDKSSII